MSVGYPTESKNVRCSKFLLCKKISNCQQWPFLAARAAGLKSILGREGRVALTTLPLPALSFLCGNWPPRAAHRKVRVRWREPRPPSESPNLGWGPGPFDVRQRRSRRWVSSEAIAEPGAARELTVAQADKNVGGVD